MMFSPSMRGSLRLLFLALAFAAGCGREDSANDAAGAFGSGAHQEKAQLPPLRQPQAPAVAGYPSSSSDTSGGSDSSTGSATSSGSDKARAPDTTSTVLRFVKQSANSYFYTTSPSDRHDLVGSNPDLRFEKALFRVATTEPDSVPVHRFRRTDGGGHFLTASEVERTALVSGVDRSRFQYDGVAFYVPRSEFPGTVPVFRLSRRDNGAYLYTADPGERSAAVRSGTWHDEGIVFHAFPAGREILSGSQSAERDRLEQLEARLTRQMAEGGRTR